MAGRSNTTLKKRQKEMARAEKARDKAAKRIERKKGEINTGEPDPEDLDGLGLNPDVLDRLPSEAPVS